MELNASQNIARLELVLRHLEEAIVYLDMIQGTEMAKNQIWNLKNAIEDNIETLRGLSYLDNRGKPNGQ